VSTTVAYSLCALLAIIALPLAFGWVGPNRLYGFRTRATLSDRALWYSANTFAGWALFAAALVSAGWVWLRPAWLDFGVFTNLVAFVVPSIAALVASSFYARAAERRPA
jgi:uncharacterized membrane protein